MPGHYNIFKFCRETKDIMYIFNHKRQRRINKIELESSAEVNFDVRASEFSEHRKLCIWSI